MISISVRRLTLILLSITLFLVVTSYGLQLIFLRSGNHVGGLVFLMNVDLEQNVPTWFSSYLHFLVSLALLAIAMLTQKRGGSYVFQWASLAGLFAFFSLDEVACIHDQLPLKLLPHETPFWRWIFPGLLVVVGISYAYISFIRALPRATQIRLAVGWVTFFFGALGIEFVDTQVAQRTGETGLIYNTLATFEEGFEMLGVILILRGLLLYLAAEFPEFTVKLRLE